MVVKNLKYETRYCNFLLQLPKYVHYFRSVRRLLQKRYNLLPKILKRLHALNLLKINLNTYPIRVIHYSL